NTAPAAPSSAEVLGMELAPLDDATRTELGLDARVAGLVIRSVEPGSDAELKGLQADDVITEVGQEPVGTLEDFQTYVTDAEAAGQKSVLLLIRRDGSPRFVAVALEES
ncbi:MAG: PDZ domain-containing protein, partial [Pseudomonadota bacterium]